MTPHYGVFTLQIAHVHVGHRLALHFSTDKGHAETQKILRVISSFGASRDLPVVAHIIVNGGFGRLFSFASSGNTLGCFVKQGENGVPVFHRKGI